MSAEQKGGFLDNLDLDQYNNVGNPACMSLVTAITATITSGDPRIAYPLAAAALVEAGIAGINTWNHIQNKTDDNEE